MEFLFWVLYRTPDDFTCQVRVPKSSGVERVIKTFPVVVQQLYIYTLSNARQFLHVKGKG